MIRVTVELIPGGIGRPEVIGTLNISNNRQGLRGSHHQKYDFALASTPTLSTPVPDKPASRVIGTVRHDRRRDVWALIGAVLDAVNKKENR